MELLDSDFTTSPSAQKQQLNLFGKLFYLGELGWILLAVLVFTGTFNPNEDYILYAFWGYYSIGGAMFAYLSGAFSTVLEKNFAFASVVAFSLWGFFMLLPNKFTSKTGMVAIISIMALMGSACFLFFLIRAVKRGNQTPVWSFIGMIIRLGLLLFPVYAMLFFAVLSR